MELRLLRYFLTVAKEQSFTKAAEQLHITQPTLSRQMAAFEEELGVTLFIRRGKRSSLTDEGILLKRRALEILNLEEITLEELKGKETVVEGTITIGCGEFAAMETLAKICKTYKEKYPLVQIALHTATADAVYEMMSKGLVDIALFLEPVDTEGLDYIRITDCDHWCVGMRPDDPLAKKEFIKKEDLIGKPLILPERGNVQSEKTFRNCRLLLRVILEPMPESWQQMDWGIRYQSKVLQSIGEMTFLYNEKFFLKSRQVL